MLRWAIVMACVAAACADETSIGADNGDVTIMHGDGKNIYFGSDPDALNSLGAIVTEISTLKAKVSDLEAATDGVKPRVQDLEDNFASMARAAMHQTELKHQWQSHQGAGNSDFFFYIGQTDIEDVLNIVIDDVGCNAHYGWSFSVSARWGADPQLFSLGDVGADQSRFVIHFDRDDNLKYKLAMYYKGWDNCNGNTDGRTHDVRYWIQSSKGSFVPNSDPDTVSQTEVLANYSPMTAHIDVVDKVDSNTDAIAALNDPATFNNRVLAAAKISRITNTYVQNKPDSDNFFYLGRVEVQNTLNVAFEDVGCNTHWGLNYELVARWGVSRGTVPVAMSLGDATDPAISNRFQFYWRPEGETYYHLAMKTTAYTSCGASTSGTQHTQVYWIQSSTGQFWPRSDAALNPAAETEDRYTLLEAHTDMSEDILELQDAFEPKTDEERTWKAVKGGDIEDVVPVNTDVAITTDASGAVTMLSTPNKPGCGTEGSSSTLLIKGDWVKVRFTATFWGRTSCFGVLGSNAYHYQRDVDLGAGESLTINGNPYPSDFNEHSLFPFDPAKDQVLSAQFMNPNDPTGNTFNNVIQACTNSPTFWGYMPITPAQCTAVGTDCFACAQSPTGKCYTGPRTIRVVLRRRQHTFEEHFPQFSDEAGISAGVSCADLSNVKWQFSDIQVLV